MKVIQTNYNNPFMGIKKGTGASGMQQSKNDMNYFVNKTADVLAQMVKEDVPESGKFNRETSVFFRVPEITQKPKTIVRYIVECDEINPKDSRRLLIRVMRENSDSALNDYLLKGTKNEILEYLNEPKNRDEIKKRVEQLIKKSNDYYSNL